MHKLKVFILNLLVPCLLVPSTFKFSVFAGSFTILKDSELRFYTGVKVL